MQEREQFKSRLGFILVAAGCAVGLGNVWKFPYICGENGGAAFILIYLIFLITLGLPILTCELAVGRASNRSIATAFNKLENEQAHWHRYKYFGIAGNYLLMMFYTMVGGWMLYYAYKMCTGQLSNNNKEQIQNAFTGMLKSPSTMILWTVIAIILAFGVCLLGLQRGVERITKVMMTLLFILMIVLAINSLSLSNASEGIRFYLVPDFHKLIENGIGNVVFAAMSHAFFTLSVGIGAMEIFGSYMKKDRKLLGEAKNILILDTLIAIIAGIIIIPACFAFGVKPDSGPSLLFITLPNVFNEMSGGRIWGTCFFIFMSFAALSTIIAVFENIISITIESKGWSRKKAVGINMIVLAIFSMPAVLGYNLLSFVQPLGADSTIMDLEDFLVSYNILPLGSLLFVLFCTKKNGWKFDNFLKEANTGTGTNYPKALKGYMTYVVPALISFIYLKGYYDMFSDKGTKMLILWMCIGILLLLLVFSFGKNKKSQK